MSFQRFRCFFYAHKPERTKQMEQILNFQVPAEGLELVILLQY